MEISAKLSKLRGDNNMSQQQLADILGVSLATSLLFLFVC